MSAGVQRMSAAGHGQYRYMYIVQIEYLRGIHTAVVTSNLRYTYCYLLLDPFGSIQLEPSMRVRMRVLIDYQLLWPVHLELICVI